tara:strand:+ start:234774 stop:235475 length:702 start_codon:yes stop_codon:yes gene_type:complete
MNYKPYLFFYHLKTVFFILSFWAPLALVRVGVLFLAISFLYATWLPISTVGYVSIVFVPGLLLILAYPCIKTKPKELDVGEYIQLYYSHAGTQRKGDIRSYWQFTLAATGSTIVCTLAAILLLRFVVHLDTETLPDESFRDYFRFTHIETLEFVQETPMLLAGIGYLIGWLLTPLFRRILFGKLESPFCSFRLPLPRNELQSHKGMILNPHLRGKGMGPNDIGERWLPEEEDE